MTAVGLANSAQVAAVDAKAEAAAKYTAPDAGAVERQVAAKLADMVSVRDFGATGDGATDDTAAIIAARAFADPLGKVTFFPAGAYVYDTTINLGAGNKIHGEGWGDQPLGAGATNSSILIYTGTEDPVRITGHQAECIGFNIKDQSNNASYGVRVLADSGNLIEGARVDVLVSGISKSGAWAFSMEATDGAIAYCDFNVRARSCANYFRILDNNDGRPAPFGFVNSNRNKLVCSGGETGANAPGYCLYVDGGNDNYILPGSVLEPFETGHRHIVVLRGSIHGSLRVEGSQQPANRPLVEVLDGESDLKFTPPTALIVNKSRAAVLDNKSSKSGQPKPFDRNLYKNPQFYGDRDGVVADWAISGAGVTHTTLDPDFIYGYRVLRVTVPAGVSATLRQVIPVLDADFSHVSHGAWVKYDAGLYPGGSASITTKVDGGTAGSGLHTGDGTYEYLGHTVKWDPATPNNIINSINLVGGSGSTVFYITCPVFAYAYVLPDLAGFHDQSVSGIQVVDLASAHGGANELTLPQHGDTFLLTSTTTPKTIARINNDSARLAVGKKIRLLFDAASGGSTLSVSAAYLSGRANIVTDQYSVVDLVSDKSGIWRIASSY